jgi:hypothetical protein
VAPLMETLEGNFGCLLTRDDAQIISYDRSRRVFGNEIAVVHLKTLRIRFVVDREEFRVEISFAHPQEEWHSPEYLIAAAESKDDAENWCVTPKAYADLLCSNLELLLESYSGANASATAERLRQLEARKRAEWIEKFNSSQPRTYKQSPADPWLLRVILKVRRWFRWFRD